MADIEEENLIESKGSSEIESETSSSPNEVNQPAIHFSLCLLEPVVLLVYFATSLSETIYENQVIYQTCINVFNFNKSDCVLLGTDDATSQSKIIESEVQEYAAKILMTKAVLGGFFPALVSIMIGSFSDKYGRRPVIFISLVGFFSIFLILSGISFLSTRIAIDPWLFLIPWLPISITGGQCSLGTGIFSVVADVTTAKERPMRMATLEAAILLGYVGGSLSSSFVLKATDSTIVYAISSCCVLFSIIYTYFFIKESLPAHQVGDHQGISASDLFDRRFIYDTFKTCFERRPKFNRTVVWLSILAIVCSVIATDGMESVFYLFVREKFTWTIKDYTLYDGGEILMQAIGNVGGLFLLEKLFGMPTSLIAVFACGSGVLDAIVKAAANYPWHLYFAIGLGIFKSITNPMCHTILSNMVPAKDVGKVFSFTTSLESISHVISAPIFSNVYRLTLNNYPGGFNVISSVIYFTSYILLTIIFGLEVAGNVEKVN